MASAAGAPNLTRKGAETRRRIVDAAAQQMWERGVASTTIDDVKAAADVSGSQMYHYFVSKEALVRAVIERQTNVILDNQSTVRLDSLRGLRRWRDMVVGIVQTMECRGGCPLGSLGGQLAEVDEVARADLAAAFGRWEAAIRDGLRAMDERGELGVGADPDLLATGLLAALQGGLLLAQLHRNTRPLEAALDAMLRLVELLTLPAATALARPAPGDTSSG